MHSCKLTRNLGTGIQKANTADMPVMDMLNARNKYKIYEQGLIVLFKDISYNKCLYIVDVSYIIQMVYNF